MARVASVSLLLFSCALCGCVATQSDVLNMEQQADEIKSQVADLQKTLASLQANQADLSVKMDQTHTDIATFGENFKDFQAGVTQLSSKMDDLEAALGQKVNSLGQTIDKQATELAAVQKEQKAQQAAAAAEASGPTPSQLFYSAQIHLNKRDYKLAAQGFEAYLKKYPKGEVADLANYYLGDAYYFEKSYESAARQYATVLDRFPKSDLTPAARLRYGATLIQLKAHLPEAKRYLQSIPEDFPRSPEAIQAKKLLKKYFPESSSEQ